MLAVLPVRDGVLPAGALEAVAECGGRALVIGSGTSDAADALTGFAATVTTIEAGAFAAGAWATGLVPHLTGEAHVVLPASPDGRDLAPRLAAALRRDLFAGAMRVTPGTIELVRDGGLSIVAAHPHAGFVATLQSGIRGVDPDHDLGRPVIEHFTMILGPASDDVAVIEVLAPDSATMDLAESPRILGGGAGLTSAEAFSQLEELAASLDASMGATRVITDRGWVGHERQIGTTGVVVDPALYLAFGISGAVQHTSGLGQPDHIVSVNTDPHCPMMQLSDLAIVSDANAVVAELLQRVTLEREAGEAVRA
jgi:electron transfer flavoprotein alpha subunit